MITITQNKVAGLEPRWAPFAGFSLLFDNPGIATAQSDGVLKVACASEPGTALDLYFRLAQTIDKLDRNLLSTTFLFCPLPPPSYHVTVWDGINVDNLSSVHAQFRGEWTSFLRGVPNSLSMLPPSIGVVTSSRLLTQSFSAIGFRFDKLTIWGHQVLVARLVPADEASAQRLQELSAVRADLCKHSREELGVGPSDNYSPHVTLGYFANREHGQLACLHLDDWTARFLKDLEGAVISYCSLDLYAFTDMASFYKLHRPQTSQQ